MTTPPAVRWAVLEGERVILRPLCAEDASEAFALIHGREPILRWLVWNGPDEVQDLTSYYQHWIRPHADGADYGLAIEERASGAFCGSIGVRFAGHRGIGDLGYWLGEPYWGRGFAKEAIGLIAHLAFAHLRATSLCAWVFVGNDPSLHALERNGFSLVRTVRNHQRGTAPPHDEWYVARLRSEWERGPAIRPMREEIRTD